MTLSELYENVEGNLEEALNRLSSENLVSRFALMYLKDSSFDDLESAVNAKNTVDAFRAVHTLKGVAANLSFTKLYKCASNLTEQLRPQKDPADSELFNALKKVHLKIVSALKDFEQGTL